ncbi:MAG TPA: TonB family protein [Blastocatellia bacterium]|nr:TonB family protein [Blastocatellia bacterium]
MKVYYNSFWLFLVLVVASSAVFPQDKTALARQHYELGRKLYRAGHSDQAIEELYTALSLQEVFFKAQYLLGRLLIDVGRYQEAVATLNAIDPVRWETARVQKLLGKAYYEMNQLKLAGRRLDQAIARSKRPDYELHYFLGLVKLRQGDAAAAVREEKRAAELNPGFAPAQKALSDSYLMEGEYAEAEKSLTRYLAQIDDEMETSVLEERLQGIRVLAQAKPESSVRKPITKPKIKRMSVPIYTEQARRYRVEGAVRVEALFATDGTIPHAFVVQGLGFGLDEAALRVAREIEFEPGEVDGQPTPMWIGVSIVFSIFEEEIKVKDDSRIALITAGGRENGRVIKRRH